MVKEIISGIIHVRSFTDFILGAIVAAIAATAGYFKLLVLGNPNAFEAITWVVVIDFICGILVALKNDKFETQKALKVVYYFTAYFALLGLVLKVEEGFPSAFWLSEAVIMPILVFQVVSVLKNLSILGIINNTLLNTILEKVDQHKDKNDSQV